MPSIIPMRSGTRRRRTWSNRNGIVTSRSIFEVRITFQAPPSRRCSDGVLPAKYEYRKFFDKRGVVAAKLGPSRSRDSFIRGLPSQSSARTISPSSSPAPRSTIQPSPSQPAANLPPRPASTIVQPTQIPAQPLAPRPASVWDDLASLSTPSSNASLPLQYTTNPSSAQPMVQQPTNFNPTNPYANFSVTQGVQHQPSPLSQPLSLPLQQTPAMSLQTQGFNNTLQPSLGGTPGLTSHQSQPTNLLTPQTQQFNTGTTFDVGLNGMNSLQQQFSAPAFHDQTFLPQRTQSFQTQQLQQPSGGMFSGPFPGQMQGFQQLAPNATGNPFYAMQQQQQMQMQPTGYTPQPQQAFGVSPANPFSQAIQPGTQFTTAQMPGWQNGGFPTQQQPWG